MGPSLSSFAHGLAGGVMIGCAAAAMLLLLGRIAGVSGLAAQAFGLSDRGSQLLAAAFIFALPAGAALAKLAGAAPVEASFPSLPYLVVGGLFVGFGARLGSGCTSGHGVCGVSRLSKRSLVATAAFMATGMLTVAAMRAAGAGW
ncbi:MAG TPA: YeeE/YedE thiosulfate transporter family protein [Methylocystis sp.]|nr:YeeE/YedE thiosulfate transporter family protein [Methylocystis sp.]